MLHSSFPRPCKYSLCTVHVPCKMSFWCTVKGWGGPVTPRKQICLGEYFVTLCPFKSVTNVLQTAIWRIWWDWTCVCAYLISGKTETTWPGGYGSRSGAPTARSCMTQRHCAHHLCLLSLLQSVCVCVCGCALWSEEEGCVSLQGFGLRLHVSSEDEHCAPLIRLVLSTIHTASMLQISLSLFLSLSLCLSI